MISYAGIGLIKLTKIDFIWEMSLESVKRYFADYGLEDRVVTLDQSTATVEEAALAHGVGPDQIAKTLSFKVFDKNITQLLFLQ